MMKHILNTTLLLLVLLLPATAYAYGYDFEVDGIYYLIDGDEVMVTASTGDSYSGRVIIPATVTYDGTTYPVTAIATRAFAHCLGLTSVTIGNSVTTIRDMAFSDCYSLTSVDIPNSVITIEDNAFDGCSSLNSIDIPSSVTAIGFRAFGGCSSVANITVASDNPKYDSRDNCNAIIETSSNTLITGCQNTVIPNTVTTIDNFAFSSCSLLTSIDIPNSVITIGTSAFSYCSSLTSVGIPNSVTAIGNRAFNGCPSLVNITVAGDNPKYDSRNDCNAIIETSSNTLISGCKSTVIPNSVTTIGDFAFTSCYSLTSISLPSSVTTIGREAFSECSSLTSINIPNSVTTIGQQAFTNCRTMTSATIGKSVTTIGSNAFQGCLSLNDVYSLIPDPSAISMGYSVFYLNTDNDYDSRTLYVPIGTVEAYQTITRWSQYFGNIVEMEKAPGDVNGDGVLSITDVTALIDLLLSGEEAPACADVDRNGNVNISDVTALIDTLLSGISR